MTDIKGADIMAKTVKLLTGDGSSEFMRQVAPSFMYRNVTLDDLPYVDAPWQMSTLYNGIHTVIFPIDSLLFWGAGDQVEVTEETFPLLVEAYNEILPSFLVAKIADDQMFKVWGEANRAAVADHRKTHETVQGYKAPKHDPYSAPRYARAVGDLFASKVMKMRPQGAAYSHIPKDLWDLFDAAGPERKVGFGNPCAPGEYLRSKVAS